MEGNATLMLNYGLMFIIIALVFIYYRLGKLLDTNNNISGVLDKVITNIETIENSVAEIKDDVEYTVKKQIEIDNKSLY